MEGGRSGGRAGERRSVEPPRDGNKRPPTIERLSAVREPLPAGPPARRTP
jgi:hypothetical protein